MSLHVIASNDTLLATLRSRLQQNALPVASARLRTPDSSLLTSLQALDDAPPGTILLLDNPVNSDSATHDDMVALEGWLRHRPQLNVLLLSEDNSKTLLTRAMRAGVREVLPLPLNPTELAQALQHWIDRASAQTGQSSTMGIARPPTAQERPGRLVAFMGCKGGNGTSFVAANMAHIMASEFGKKCAFVDLDLQCDDASFYLGSGANKHSLGAERNQAAFAGQPLQTPRLGEPARAGKSCGPEGAAKHPQRPGVGGRVPAHWPAPVGGERPQRCDPRAA